MPSPAVVETSVSTNETVTKQPTNIQHLIDTQNNMAAPQMGVWTYGICSCMEDRDICIRGCFCPCILAGNNSVALGDDYTKNCILAVVPIAHIIMGTKRRETIRSRLQIPGTGFTDCCVICLLYPNSLCQEALEIKVRGGKIDRD